ncbi:GDSL family lipase [Corticibacter populi]|uniref:GDSL family lipase n=1 Tax=Corticibacter populi TaxID=1550736 RepID=A0A3M6QP69_9BURK|nr:SGNH/GDSL hydrolase family protein [Corticibacter populi]RMX04805.1 GDSL family lipase [Corticibacter populi]RZS33782.1 phospholipase/lecithinase/hemolysin [Corticibacter populi]
MAFQWSRCIAFVAAGVAALSLTACGSSTVESAISPTRFIAFGDATADIGQSGSYFTVNDDSAALKNWTEQVASSYGRSITAQANGGYSYAEGNARVTAEDATGGGATSVQAQVSNFLASNQFGEDDLVLISAGASDVIALARQVMDGTLDVASARQSAREAGIALMTQVKRLEDNGAKYVVVALLYRLDETPWGTANSGYTGLLDGNSDSLVRHFNDGIKIAAVEQKVSNALSVDFEYYVNYMYGYPSYFSFSNIADPVCNSVDDGNGIGIGTGQVSSAKCTTDTLIDSSYDSYMFADPVYVTPSAHRQLGTYAYDEITDRW